MIPVGVTIAIRGAGGYSVGSIVEYTCDRPGYELKGILTFCECVKNWARLFKTNDVVN